MTAPALPVSGSEDIPLATVKNFGPTELVGVVTMIAGLLASFFGKDWGIAAHAQAIVTLGFLVGPLIIGISRSIKHSGVHKGNAIVLAAQIAANAQVAAAGVQQSGLLPTSYNSTLGQIGSIAGQISSNLSPTDPNVTGLVPGVPDTAPTGDISADGTPAPPDPAPADPAATPVTSDAAP